MDLKNEISKKLLKSFIPQVQKMLKNPESKRKLLGFINTKKDSVEPIGEENDIVLMITSNDRDLFISIYTTIEIERRTILCRQLGQINYDEFTQIIENLLNEFINGK